jgi:hypothetical protein
MYEKSFHDVNDRYIKYGERVKSFIDYQIMLQTTPGDAMFEGTIRYDEYWKSINMMLQNSIGQHVLLFLNIIIYFLLCFFHVCSCRTINK